MTTTPTTRIRRDAAASVFAFGVAGLALLVHAAGVVSTDWRGGLVPVDVTDQDGRSTTVVVTAERAPDWAVVALRAAQAAEWVIGAAVLVLLTVCVLRMMRGQVFTRTTVRVASGASWALLALLGLPVVVRLLTSDTVLRAAGADEGMDVRLVGTEFWYLYVGMMTLSFVTLVLRRGSQMEEDQEGLI